MIFLEDYNNRVKEINTYFEFVFIIDKTKNINLENTIFKNNIILDKSGLSHLNQITDYPIDNDLKKTLRANAYLLLYNLIEGSINSGIDAIFSTINQSQLDLKCLKKDIRELYLEYSMIINDENQNLKAKDRKNLRRQLNNLIDKKVEFKHKNNNNIIMEGHQAYKDKVSKGEISGNIDAIKLQELAKKYGFVLPTINITNELLTIKNKRNQLAHGEITFAEAGKEESIEDLFILKNIITHYFDNLMNNIKVYIENQEFKT
jgi:hypothetical protein